MLLIEPTLEYERQIRAYRRAFLEAGSSMDGTSELRRFEEPRDWIAFLDAHRDAPSTPGGRAPASQYIYVREEDRKIVGMIDLRPVLNRYLALYGGHVGYSVAPDERRRGYATRMLAAALPLLRARGVQRALITCERGNEGSRKTILRNGGRYESTVFEPDEGVCLERWWIELTQ